MTVEEIIKSLIEKPGTMVDFGDGTPFYFNGKYGVYDIEEIAKQMEIEDACKEINKKSRGKPWKGGA